MVKSWPWYRWKSDFILKDLFYLWYKAEATTDSWFKVEVKTVQNNEGRRYVDKLQMETKPAFPHGGGNQLNHS